MAEGHRGWGCWLWGCAITVFVLIGGIGACVYMVRGAHAGLTAATEAYLEDVGRGDLEAAYDRLGEGVTTELDEQEYINFETAVRERLGARTGVRLAGMNINRTPQGSRARVEYLAEFERGSARIRFSLEERADGWVIQGVTYSDSSELEALLTCPKCGQAVSQEDRFCPQCGERLPGAE